MTSCISACWSGRRMIVAVHQCLRNSILKQERLLCRELRTYAKHGCSEVFGTRGRTILCQPKAYLWRTDLSAIKKCAVYYTGCSHFSSDRERRNACECDEEKNLSRYQKFKLMYKRYWYVLIPVHLATSAVWFGSFYYLAARSVFLFSFFLYWFHLMH